MRAHAFNFYNTIRSIKLTRILQISISKIKIYFTIRIYSLVCVVSNEVAEEPVTLSTFGDVLYQRENEQQDHVDEEKEEKSMEKTIVAVNVTNAVVTNVTKVNCSSEKIHGPVEV